MDKSSELVLSESNADLSEANARRKNKKSDAWVSAKQIELDMLLEELAEIIEVEGGVVIP